MRFLGAKYAKMRLRPELRYTPLGSLQRSPDPLAGFKLLRGGQGSLAGKGSS